MRRARVRPSAYVIAARHTAARNTFNKPLQALQVETLSNQRQRYAKKRYYESGPVQNAISVPLSALISH